jgi:hypothetical protein
VHDIDEDPMPPPAFLDRVERPEPDRSVLDQDTVEHPAPADQLPLGKDDEDDEDDGSGRVSE